MKEHWPPCALASCLQAWSDLTGFSVRDPRSVSGGDPASPAACDVGALWTCWLAGPAACRRSHHWHCTHSALWWTVHSLITFCSALKQDPHDPGVTLDGTEVRREVLCWGRGCGRHTARRAWALSQLSGCCCCLVTPLCLILFQPHGLRIFLARILVWVAISFLQGNFLTQGSNPHLLPVSPASQVDSLSAEPLEGPAFWFHPFLLLSVFMLRLYSLFLPSLWA